jgi:hypothetical protein
MKAITKLAAANPRDFSQPNIFMARSSNFFGHRRKNGRAKR